MPHESYLAGSPEDWIKYAVSDLELARILEFCGKDYVSTLSKQPKKLSRQFWFLTQFLSIKPITLEYLLIF